MPLVVFSNEHLPLKVIKNKSADLSSITWLQALPSFLRSGAEEMLDPYLQEVEEIRLRVNRPLLFRIGAKEMTCDLEEWRLTTDLCQGYVITKDDLEKTVEVLCQSSLYAWEDELSNGYLTIQGGHRVGFVGKAVLEKGRVRTLKEISGLNYRIGRQVKGCADGVMPFLLKNNRILHTLIVSAPQCGKTTLLRDIVRQLSEGVPRIKFQGINVGLVDERSEIAGMYQGQPQFEVGLRTDVLDACPKAQGMIMLIRSMSPGVIATDEIGRSEDVEALYEALQAGVAVITTVHGGSLLEVQERPILKELLDWRFFERLVFLSRRKGVGTIDAILDGKTLERVR